jgi:hypothetical protein
MTKAVKGDARPGFAFEIGFYFSYLSRHTNVIRTGRLIASVLPVIVGNCERTGSGKRGPLPPLVGYILCLSLVDAGEHSWIDTRSGEARASVSRYADQDVIVAGSRSLHAGVGIITTGESRASLPGWTGVTPVPPSWK